MRNSLTFLLIISSIVFAQFEPGTISAGALFGYNSYGDSENDSDRLTTITAGGSQIELIIVKPTVNYFIASNISIDGIVNIMRINYGDGDPQTSRLFGGGATMYFKENLYVGGSIALQSSKVGDNEWGYESSAQFVGIQLGLLHKVAENVYLDVGANYLMGIGDEKFEDWEDGDTWKFEDKNTRNAYGINVGIKAFFKQ